MTPGITNPGDIITSQARNGEPNGKLAGMSSGEPAAKPLTKRGKPRMKLARQQEKELGKRARRFETGAGISRRFSPDELAASASGIAGCSVSNPGAPLHPSDRPPPNCLRSALR